MCDFRTILGAVSVYALLGLLFALFYFAVGRWSDDEFFTGVAEARSSDYLFFSYTTLTSTGYGNLIPAGTIGQSFAVLEMLVGQIFLVTLVAGLVSLWRPGSGKTLGRRDQSVVTRVGPFRAAAGSGAHAPVSARVHGVIVRLVASLRRTVQRVGRRGDGLRERFRLQRLELPVSRT